MGKQKKYYVIWEGREPGVYSNWMEAKAQIDGYANAKYKGFTDEKEAYEAYAVGRDKYRKQKLATETPEKRSIAVDAACSGNPGVMEYRGVALWDGQVVFHEKHQLGTNNIGEFLAIVHALALFKKKGYQDITIYSDSQIAINWIKHGKCKTKLQYSPLTAELFDIVRRAELWLENNQYENKIVKWPTDVWGEIPADFGRKG